MEGVREALNPKSQTPNPKRVGFGVFELQPLNLRKRARSDLPDGGVAQCHGSRGEGRMSYSHVRV